MNYQLLYDKLIDRARGRVLSVYFERHHVKPKCLGGDDSTSNIVNLTPEEHYVVHQLLVKLYPNDRGVAFAAVGFSKNLPCRQFHLSKNKAFGWLRRHCSSFQIGRKHSPETIAKMRAMKVGKPKSEATKAKIAASLRGSKLSSEQKAKIAAASKVMWQQPERFIERNAKIANALRGHEVPPEVREKIRLSNKLTWAGPRRG